MKKIILIIIVLGCIGLVAYFIHFVTGVSATSPPIKKYTYSGSANELVSGIKKYTFNTPNVTFEIKDTVGNKENGYALYMTINVKNNSHDVQYGLECEENSVSGNSTNIIIKLIEAYDKTNNTGGYQKGGKGVKPLVDSFETGLLVELSNKENITLIPFKD